MYSKCKVLKKKVSHTDSLTCGQTDRHTDKVTLDTGHSILWDQDHLSSGIVLLGIWFQPIVDAYNHIGFIVYDFFTGTQLALGALCLDTLH